jgi:hypothetical protein
MVDCPPQPPLSYCAFYVGEQRRARTNVDIVDAGGFERPMIVFCCFAESVERYFGSLFCYA